MVAEINYCPKYDRNQYNKGMNKKTLIIVLVLLAVVVGALAYVAVMRGESHESTNKPQQRQSVEAPTNTQMPASAGVYEPYDEAKLASTDGDILLFFHASWCPQCRAIEKSIYDGGLPDGVTVYKVDYDTNQALRQRYGVTLQTTFVKVDASGNKLASFVAYSEPTFSAVRQNLLP